MSVGDDRDRYIHLKGITVGFIERRPTPTPDLELVFKDHAGVIYKSNKFKQGDIFHWNIDTYVRGHTCGTLRCLIRRVLFNINVAKISVEFEPNDFRDGSVVLQEDRNHRVIVNFVCGRSQSLADVTFALGSHTWTTALASRVLRFLRHPQLEALALPPPASEQRCNVQCAAIHWLNNDVLLVIFNYYRLDEENGWNDRLGWCQLSQVCRRWRYLILESTFHLGLEIECINGTGLVDTLDHLPPLPLLVNYSNVTTEQDILAVCHALRFHDRVCYLHLNDGDLDLPASILHKCLMLMDVHFPRLEDLALSSTGDRFTPLTLPKAFLAPNLRRLSLSGIGLPKRLQLLTSTFSLVSLNLWGILASSYFRPRLLVARLGSLPQLEELYIGFSIPIPRPSTERELLGEPGTPVTLPNLKTLSFQGVSSYLESFFAQIRAPVLKKLEITLFNQIAFTLRHLSHFISVTEGLNLPVVKVFFWYNSVFIFMTNSLERIDGPFFLKVMCEPLDWQIDCAAQICSALAPALLVSNVGPFALDMYGPTTLAKWLDGEIDVTTWHELLRSFVGARELHIETGLLGELSRALQVDEVGSDPGFLPDLQDIIAERNEFASFIDARRVGGHPVRFLPSPPPVLVPFPY